MRLDIRTRPKARRRRLDAVSTVVGALVGLLGGTIGSYFLDHDSGRARRTRLRAQAGHRLRAGRRRLSRGVRARIGRTRGRVLGFLHRLHPAGGEEIDDVTLAHRVESILFRDPSVPKGRISINAESGSVFLRGEVESERLIGDLVQAVRAVTGVRRVENLLHVPGTPAPTAQGGTLVGHQDDA